MDSLLASSKPITTTNTNSKGSEEFLNNLMRNNPFSTFSNTTTIPSSNTNNNTNNGFSFDGMNNSNNTNNTNTSSQFDFKF